VGTTSHIYLVAPLSPEHCSLAPNRRATSVTAAPVVENFQHRLITLLHQVQLHQHDGGLLWIRGHNSHSEEGGHRGNADLQCQAPTGATVAQEPGPRPETVNQLLGATLSTMNRVRTGNVERVC
jgi:hypothetical protein